MVKILDWIDFSGWSVDGARVRIMPRGRSWAVAAVLAIMSAGSAHAQEISGACAQVVGTYLTTNGLAGRDDGAVSRSLLVLTNGGHALRFDSDEMRAVVDRRAFGDSAGVWRCDGVDDDGTVRVTTAMLDFTYPGSEGQSPQIVRLDVTGRYRPDAATLELKGQLRFFLEDADAQDPAAVARGIYSTTDISLRGLKVELPASKR